MRRVHAVPVALAAVTLLTLTGCQRGSHRGAEHTPGPIVEVTETPSGLIPTGQPTGQPVKPVAVPAVDADLSSAENDLAGLDGDVGDASAALASPEGDPTK